MYVYWQPEGADYYQRALLREQPTCVDHSTIVPVVTRRGANGFPYLIQGAEYVVHNSTLLDPRKRILTHHMPRIPE